MKVWNRSLTVLFLSIMLVVAGCSTNNGNNSVDPEGNNNNSAADTESADSPEAEKLKIKTSFYPMYEFTRQVAGDVAEVENLVPAGVDPHDWEPTPQNMAAITEADVFVYNGAGMEMWIDQVLGSAAGTSLTVIEASQGIDIMEGDGHHHHHHGDEAHEDHDHDHDHDHDGEAHGDHDHDHDHDHDGEAHEDHDHDHDHDHDGEAHEDHDHDHDHDYDGEAHEDHDHDHGHGHDHDHGGLDPHVWLSPALAIEQVRNIEKGLSEAAPEYKDVFKANADAYVATLEELDREFREGLQDAKRKDFITQHSAFGYLAREYGLTQVPIAGLSPDQEPSASRMAEIVEFAREHNVTTIFFETLVSSNVADTIAAELGAKTAVLNPLEGLTESELAANMDYVTVMRQNLEALKAALNE